MKYIFLPFFLLINFVVFAQPANNNYASATDVSSLISSCSANAAYTTVAATNDNNPGSCWNTTGGSNVWFSFVATTTQLNTQLFTGGAEGTMQYAYMALWESDGTTQLGCVTYTSQYSDLELSTVGLTIGNTYYISVDNHNGSAGYRGTFKLCLQDAATYDYYEGAIDVSSLLNSCSANAAYTTVQATNDKAPGSCWNTTGGSNRWFKFVATTTQLNAQLFTGGAEGTMQFPYMALWASDGTSQLGCVTYTSQYSDLNLSLTGLTIGNTYYISVDNHNGSSGYRGSFKLCLQDVATYDYYEAAMDISPIINSCSANAAYTTEQATNDMNPGSCWNTTGGSNRWFKFVATSTQINAQLFTGGAEGTMQYPYLALWASDGTTQLGCVTYTSQYSDLNLSLTGLTIGNTYYISVDNHNGSSGYRGSFKLCLQDVATYDYYEAAMDISSIINSCSANAAYTTEQATNDKNPGSCWNTTGGSNRWFKFVATTTQINAQLFTGGAEGTMQFPYMALWASNGTTQLGCVNYTSQYSDLELSIPGLTIGDTYYISVDNHNGSSGYRGTFKLCLQDAVTYDYYEGAVNVSSIINSCSSLAAYTTSQATSDKNPGSCWNTTGGSNRWFKFVATTTQINAQLFTGGSEGTMQYPYMAIWASDGTTQLGCVNYTSQYSDLELSIPGLTIGNTYYISVDNHNGSSGYRGTFTLCLQDIVSYDYYEGAVLLNDLNNYCSSDAAYTTAQATNDKNPGSCWNTTGGSNRWFKFVATTTQIKVQVKTGGSEGTIQYAYSALWESNGTTQLACVNYSSQYSDLEMSYNNLTIGNTYYVSVDNHNGSTGYRGTFTMCINDKADYDFYEAAEELTNLNNYCSSNAAYTTVLATKDKNHGSCWNTVGSSNRWFKFTASATNATIQLKTGGAEGTLQYPYLALWQSNGTTQIVCANYTSQYSDLTISTVVLVPGTDYYFSVDNHNGSTGYRGTFTICIDNVDQDYYSLASGDWKTIGNWSNTCHTCGASAGTPDIGDVVYIQGHAMTLNSSVSVAELNLTGNDAATSLTIDNSTLTVTGITRLTSANNFDNSLVLQNSGDLTISNDLTLTRSGGANVFDITAGSGSIVSVGRDLIVVSSGGSATTNNFTFNGTSSLNVTRDVLLGNTGGVKSVFTFNNTSSLNVTRDLAFSATAANKLEMIFNNTSSLNLYRHLTKSGGFGLLTFNTGTNLNLLGSVYQQNVAGTTGSGGDIFTFANITVNNTKITTPQITLTGPVSVSGTFTHTKGVIKTTSTNILNLTTSNLPSIGSSTAYIDGPLNAIVAASGATTVNLPIGKGTNYRPAVLFTNHSDASSVTYTGELVASSPSALGYTLPGSIERVSYVRYWQIDRSAVANFTSAMVRLYYNTDDGVTDFTNLTVAKNIGAGTTWNDITGTATGNNSGSILSGAFASFSKFTLANKTAGSNPLPIELISFTGEKCDEDVCLSWTTASEINNDRFEIERSANGEDFSVIASHDSKATNGTSNVNLNYNFVDSNPLEGLSYYRLNQFDFNGENEYSNIVSIESKNELENELTVFPNPSNGLFTVDCSSFSTKEIKLVITDLLGRKFIDMNISEGELNEGRYEFNLFNKLNSGVYFIEVTSGSKTIGTKLILN